MCVLSFARSSFNDFTAKHGKDERFKGVEKMRDREQIFGDYVIELRQREKEESRTHREKVHHFISSEFETDGHQIDFVYQRVGMSETWHIGKMNIKQP